MKDLATVADLHAFEQLVAEGLCKVSIGTFTIMGSMPLSFGNFPMNFFRSYSTYSKTSTSLRFECTTSYSLTMLGWLSSFRIEISRIAVLGMPSSSLSSRIFLRAYSWSVSLSTSLNSYRALYKPHRRCPRPACRPSRISPVYCAASLVI